MMKGYKAFDNEKNNRYGMSFEEGKTYTVDGPLEFGNKGNGFHFCERLEDTLRYVPAMEKEVQIAEVTSLGEVVESWDEYYGYFDLFAARTLRIDKFLTREEIMNMFLDSNTNRVVRFVSGYKLTPEEVEMFKLNYCDDNSVLKAISYYQEGNKDAYNLDNKVKVKRFDK